jgi:holo-[acyl-carrier protein] synthase
VILGIGTDLVELDRMRKILAEPTGQRFLERILTPAERDLAAARAARRHEFAAGRFAAKEAVSKALGCGIGRLVGLQDMEVLPDESGRPVCRLSGGALERLGFAESPPRIHLSITHSETMAAAYAVIESKDTP